jgi:hypothetical protein
MQHAHGGEVGNVLVMSRGTGSRNSTVRGARENGGARLVRHLWNPDRAVDGDQNEGAWGGAQKGG